MDITSLFTGETAQAAWTLAAVAFAAGAIVAAIILKACCRCSKDGGSSQERSAKSGGVKRDQKRSAANAATPRFEKKHPAPADGSIEIYVGNLSYDVTDDDLRKEFEAFGTVNYARVVTNRYNNKSKGFGFVHMPNHAEVDKALEALNDKEILGRRIKCNVAKNVG